jgi:hypothetical protein
MMSRLGNLEAVALKVPQLEAEYRYIFACLQMELPRCQR